MEVMLHSTGLVLLVVLLAFASGNDLHRLQNTIDTMAIGLENLENLLRLEQSRNRRLQSRMSERLEKMESDLGNCDCSSRDTVRVFLGDKVRVSSLLNGVVTNLEKGLLREKVSRREMENAIEILKTDQRDNEFNFGILGQKVQQLVNLSDRMPICKEEGGAVKIDDENGEQMHKNVDEVNEQKTCPFGFSKLGSGCYYFQLSPLRVTYDMAVAECERMNASLVSVETVEERDIIQQYLQSIHTTITKRIKNGFLTSAKRISENWKWMRKNKEQSNIPSTVLENWATGRPMDRKHGGICLSFWPNEDYMWADTLCGIFAREFVCENTIRPMTQNNGPD